jgi:hypothetical protein
MEMVVLQCDLDIIKEEPHSDIDTQPVPLTKYCNVEDHHINVKCENDRIPGTLPIMIKAEVSYIISYYSVICISSFQDY